MLTGKKIVDEVEAGNIIIDPFHTEQVNPNSYDVRLSKYIGFIKTERKDVDIIEVGSKLHTITLFPNNVYLGSTIETAGSNKYVPRLEGKSSLARLGLSVHLTAGFGDIGFINKWTLELTCVIPITLIIGMRIAQISFYEPVGEITEDFIYNGHYAEFSDTPVMSKINESINKDSLLMYYNSL